MGIDYAKVGLKCGLEIHQQLDTNKLFCNCPSILRSDEPDLKVSRKLHAVAGESGEIDIAAKHEAEKDKEFVYQFYNSSNCLVELDEEPPHELNREALEIALHVALLLNCKIQPITQIMRKTVIDGSNTSGFQRTVLIAHSGYVETSFGRVGIDSVCLEEDSARIVGKEKGKAIYRLDRLGIPLVEIATAPDIHTPEQAKEVALYLGDILRSCNVKRGIGTIRQDVNVSINGSKRVEIKGFQDPKMMGKTIDNEILRQQECVKKKNCEHEVRNALKDGTTEFLRPMPGAARMYPETDLPLLKISRDFINHSKKTLPKLRSEEQEDLKKKGLGEDMIKLLFKQNKLGEFKELIGIYDDLNFVAKLLLVFTKEIAKKNNLSLEKVEEIFNKDVLVSILESLRKKEISQGDVKGVLERIVSGDSLEDSLKVEKEDVSVVEEKILKLINEKPGLNPNAYMGLVMKEFKGKINPAEAMTIIKKLLA